ncbi:hypothetical protein ABZX39_33110 [Streptomyces collinus]|uniref:hypothetical protein n=1 Tax=Streptomyces collinus TaxID=42684 RepID=UPI0033A1756D
MTNSTSLPALTGEQLLPLLVADKLRHQQHDYDHPLRLAPLPPCPLCQSDVTKQTFTLGMGDLDERVLTCEPCGHRMTYSLRVAEQLQGQAQRLAVQEEEQPVAAEATEATELTFFTRVMEIFYLSDNREDLIWHVTDGRVHLSVNVSDIFAWGGADAEEITPKALPVLEKAWEDAKAIGQEFLMAPLYAARVRGERPQGAAYPSTAAAQALFDACGPEREVGLGNPRPVPTPVDAEGGR